MLGGGGGGSEEDKEKANGGGQFADVSEQATKGGGGSFHLHRLQVCKQEELSAKCSGTQRGPKGLITAARDVSSFFPLVVPDGTI